MLICLLKVYNTTYKFLMDVEIYDDVANQYQGKILKIFGEIFPSIYLENIKTLWFLKEGSTLNK